MDKYGQMVDVVSEHLLWMYRMRVDGIKKALLGVCVLNSRNERRIRVEDLLKEMGIENRSHAYLVLNELRKLKVVVNLPYRGWYITQYGRKVLNMLMKKILMYEMKRIESSKKSIVA